MVKDISARTSIRKAGQQALYPVNDPGSCPFRPLRQKNGEWLRLQIHLRERDLAPLLGGLCWQDKALSARHNDFANTAAHRGITVTLCGGCGDAAEAGDHSWNRWMRCCGRLVCKPEVCHLNEGHAGFAVLERARCYMEDHANRSI